MSAIDNSDAVDLNKSPPKLPPMTSTGGDGSSSPGNTRIGANSSVVAALKSETGGSESEAAGPSKALSALTGPSSAKHQRSLKLLKAATTTIAASNAVQKQAGFVGQKRIKELPSSLPEKARRHLTDNADHVHFAVGPKNGQKLMKEVLHEIDKDAMGVIQYNEWLEYCEFTDHNKSYKGENKYKNALDEQLQLMILAALEGHVEQEDRMEVFHAVFCVFDENDSGKMTFEEFEDGLMALGLLPHNFIAPNGQRKQYAPMSLYLFSADNKFREICVYLALNKWFDFFILICILANSLVLAMQDYEDVGALPAPDSADYKPNFYNKMVDSSEIIFNVVFTLECVIKVVAMGFWVDPGSYLRDYWNWLDFIVVIVGLLGTMPGMGNFSSLRTFRVMRPLRTLTALPGMRMLISALLTAIPLMVDVLMILAFVFTIFGVLGVQLFNGWQHHYCRATQFPVNGTWAYADRDSTRVCDPTGTGFQCEPGSWCGSELEPPPGYSITEYLLPPESVSFGYTRFDNILQAWLTIFQCITMEGWVIVMYQLIDASTGADASLPPCAIYFLLLIVLGSFFLMEFVFAVIFYRFTLCHDGQVKVYQAKQDKVALKYMASDEGFVTDNEAMRLEQEKLDAAKLHELEHPPSSKLGHHSHSSGRNHGGGPGSAKVHVEEQDVETVTGSNGTETGGAMVATAEAAPSPIRRMVESPHFEIAITVCIVINTITLALNEYPEDENRVKVLEKINLVLTFIFLFEMVAKLAGLGLREYVRDSFNLFDAFIVVVSMIELVAAEVGGGGGDRSSLSALRAFRLFRIFKLARSWVTLRNLLTTIARTLKEMGNFLLLLVLFMYIVALVGMQFFATKFKFHPETGEMVVWEPAKYQVSENHPPAPCSAEFCWKDLDAPYLESRTNFNTLSLALTCVFQILTGEDWNMIMYDGMRVGGWPAAAYFIAVQILGNTIILNLFLAILAINFEIDDDDEDEDEGKEEKEKKEAASGKVVPEGEGEGEGEKVEEKKGLQGMVFKIISHQHFDNCVLLAILISSVLLAVDNPLDDPDSTEVAIIKAIDLVLTVLFIVEMLLKIIGLGMKKYWSDGWNVLDGTIVIISIINLASGDGGGNLKSLRSLRALRALRPLRVISRAPSLKKVVNALLAAIPPAMNVTLVCLLFFLIFAIVLTDTFKGKLYSCDFDSLSDEGQRKLALEFGLTKHTFKKPFMKSDCLAYGGEWSNANQHFDHVGQSMSTLFQMSTTEGWVEVMLSAIDATEEEQNPVQDYDRSKTILFVAFMVVGFMFAVNLFVGSVMDTFDKMNKKGETLFLTPEQQEWVDTMRMMARVGDRIRPRAPPPTHPLRAWCFGLASGENSVAGAWLESFIMGCILLNTLVMAMVQYQQTDVMTRFIDTANNIFALIFFFEAAIKITGLGRTYFKSTWNCFDLVIVMATILCFVLEEAAGLEIGNLANLARAFRMALIFRLFKSMKDLQALLGTMLANLVPVANITALLFLMLFIYTVMGVQLFSGVLAPQDMLGDFANFQTFGKAFFLLFRCLTGEAWNGVMFELIVDTTNSDCVEDPTYAQYEAARQTAGDSNVAIGCGPPAELVYIYYVTFVIITSFIVLNLFIAVIIGGFEEAMKNENSFSEEVFEDFVVEWSKIDQDGDMFMSQEELRILLTPKLLTSMGFNTQYLHCDVNQVKLLEFITSLELKLYDGLVYFPNVAKQLGLKSFELSVKKKTGNPDVGDELRNAPEIDDSAWPTGARTEELMAAALDKAAIKIQNAFRARKARRVMQEKRRERDHKASIVKNSSSSSTIVSDSEKAKAKSPKESKARKEPRRKSGSKKDRRESKGKVSRPSSGRASPLDALPALGANGGGSATSALGAVKLPNLAPSPGGNSSSASPNVSSPSPSSGADA